MDWARYWRAGDRPLEAMYAHFERHVYHRHSHETYSFGVTDEGAQSFRCRGGRHTSAAGMVMAFNPEDPHDGHATDALGFTYRIVHIGAELVSDVVGGALPLFDEPVVHDPLLAGRLRALHEGLLTGAGALRRDELLTAAIASLVHRAARSRPAAGRTWHGVTGLEVARSGEGLRSAAGQGEGIPRLNGGAGVAGRVREVIRERYLEELTPDDLIEAVGVSRFAVYRAFRAAYGMPPSDYQRQLRLREARRLIAAGVPLADAAARAGFADQSHLSRWFTRYFGLAPGAYRAAAS